MTPRNVETKAWSLWIGDKRVTQNFDKAIREIIHDQQLQQYWQEKGKLTTANAQHVNWEGVAHAAANERRTRTIGIVKLFSGNIATNETLQKWKWRTDAKCPRCGEETETTYHVLQCNHPAAVNRWNDGLRQAKKWMNIELSTNPLITDAILHGIHNWKTQSTGTEDWNRDTRDASTEQQDIGWWNMLMGLHSNKWQLIQQSHYRHIGSKQSAKRWTSLVIRKLWEIAWDMWQHRCRVAHDHAEVLPGISDDLDQTIKEEARHVPPNCPTHYRQHFSRRTVQAVLRKTRREKQQWL